MFHIFIPVVFCITFYLVLDLMNVLDILWCVIMEPNRRIYGKNSAMVLLDHSSNCGTLGQFIIYYSLKFASRSGYFKNRNRKRKFLFYERDANKRNIFYYIDTQNWMSKEKKKNLKKAIVNDFKNYLLEFNDEFFKLVRETRKFLKKR